MCNAHPSLYSPQKRERGGLKAIILGGEALDEQLLVQLKQLTSAEIFNIYGPTETTVWSTNTRIK